MSAVKINCALKKLFFSFRNLQTYVRLSKLEKLYFSAIDKCAMVIVLALAVEK